MVYWAQEEWPRAQLAHIRMASLVWYWTDDRPGLPLVGFNLLPLVLGSRPPPLPLSPPSFFGLGLRFYFLKVTWIIFIFNSHPTNPSPLVTISLFSVSVGLFLLYLLIYLVFLDSTISEII